MEPWHAKLSHFVTGHAFVREGLRGLFAPATMVQRVALSDDANAGGITFDAGVVLCFCPPAMHRSATMFPAAELFDPVRFSDQSGPLAIDPSYAESGRPSLVTFGGGPRGCPGRYLGMNILRLLFVKFAEVFEVSRCRLSTGEEDLGATPLKNCVRKWVVWDCVPLQARLVCREAKVRGRESDGADGVVIREGVAQTVLP